MTSISRNFLAFGVVLIVMGRYASAEPVKPAPVAAPVPRAEPASPLQAGSPGPITSFVIAGGGGTSASGNFQLSGTIGQSAAGGAISGSTYSLTSGFWTLDSSAPTSGNKRRGQITSQ